MLLEPNGTYVGKGAPGIPKSKEIITQLQELRPVTKVLSTHIVMLTPISLKSPFDGASIAVLVVARPIPTNIVSRLYLILLGIVVLILAYGVSKFLSQRITDSFYALIQATKSIARGEITSQLPPNRRNDPEVNELFEAISQMAHELQAARDAERQFLLSISHELRTPLTSIVGFSESIIDGAIDDPRRAAETILRESHRLEHLVGDLLELANLQSSQFSLERSIVSLDQLLDDLARRYEPKCIERGIRFSYEPLPQGYVINTDPTRFLQILENFLENAYKFTTSQIRLTGRMVDDAIAISVIDDGPGIDESDRGHLFREQYRSPRISTKTKGSGLGLMIVGQLSKALGLAVSYRSPATAQGGTEMRLSIPSPMISQIQSQR